jgi:hypothetical protein
MLPKMRKVALASGNSGTLDGESGSTPLCQLFSQNQFLNCIHGTHNGKAIADAALHLLNRAGITAKVHFLFNSYLSMKH